jgi:outer membrane protein assembly factor BamD (BamD/ComL family)
MAASKETKEILKKPDEFITFSTRAIQWAREHSRPLSYIGIAVAGTAALFLAVSTYLGYADRKGQDAYNKAYQLLSEQGEKTAKKEGPLEAVNMFQEVLKDHSLSDASRLALAQLGDLKFKEGNYDEAISLYRAFMDKTANETRYANMTKLALAACFEAKGDTANAITLLESIKDYPLLKESALWGLARLYRHSQQADKEKEALRQLTDSYPDSAFVPFAKARLLGRGA